MLQSELRISHDPSTSVSGQSPKIGLGSQVVLGTDGEVGMGGEGGGRGGGGQIVV